MNKYDNYNPNIISEDDYRNKEYEESLQSGNESSGTQDKKGGQTKTGKTPKKPKTPKKTEPDSVVIQIIADVKKFFTSPTLRLIVGAFLVLLAAYLAISFVSYLTTCIKDQSAVLNSEVGMSGPISNHGGEGGARISELLINQGFGLASFVVIFWLAAVSFKMLGVKLRFKTVNFTIKCIVALIAASLLVGLITIALDSPVNWGGFHGRYVNEFIIHFVGWTGAFMVALFAVAVFCILCLRDLFKWLWILRQKAIDKRNAMQAERAAEMERRRQLEEMEQHEIEEAAADVPVQPEEAESEYSIDDEEESQPDEQTMDFHDGDTYQIPDDEIESVVSETEETPADNVPDSGDETQPTEEGEKLKVNVNGISEYATGKYPEAEGIPGKRPYKLPPYDLMRAESQQILVDEEEQLANEEKIRSTLKSFGIEIQSIEATVGPTVTLYEIMLDTGIKISRVRNLADEISMSLAAAASVRIIAPIPGKSTVGIEVGNRKPVTVSMRTILKSKAYQETKYQLPIALGSTIQNEVYVADLADMPHLLVAGATGQGKSVGLNAIITSLLYSKTPDELKFVMVDPKIVEFGFYEKIKDQYMAQLPDAPNPIVTDTSRVVPTLNSLCIEMDSRYLLLRAAGCRQIKEYNKKVINKELNPADGHRYLPYIVLVVDEFSDLITTAGKEVETPITRLAQKARAVGMHVIIATQRPSADVITSVIKANFPARIAFKVTNGFDSKTILNTTSAYQLIGRGDMLVSHRSELVRVQCAFVDTPEVESVCDYIARQPYPRGAYILPEPPETGETETKTVSASERDPLFEDVARMVVAANTASTSALQRRYSIGFTRAGRIMDQLEMCGIVGASHDGKPRNVLVDETGLERIFSDLGIV